MTPFYTAYTKSINGTTFYFVKSYLTFPEYQNVPPVLETFGMHADFKKACNIANIFNKEIQQELLTTIGIIEPVKASPIRFGETRIYSLNNLKRKYTSFPSLLKLFPESMVIKYNVIPLINAVLNFRY